MQAPATENDFAEISSDGWLPDLWAAPEWLIPAFALGLILVAMVAYSWRRSQAPAWVRLLGVTFKVTAIGLILAVLLEPMRQQERVEPKANVFVLMADNSLSMKATGPSEGRSWLDEMRETLDPLKPWRQRLETDFDVRTFHFDRRLQQTTSTEELTGEGTRTDVAAAISQIEERFQSRPVAGVLLLTDGVSTDPSESLDALASAEIPVYPVVVGSKTATPDIRITHVTASETNFEAAPVTVAAEIRADGFAGKTVVAKLISSGTAASDEEANPAAADASNTTGSNGQTGDKVVDEQRVANVVDGQPFQVRFRVKPETGGVQFFRVEASVEGESEELGEGELTGDNNVRNLVVGRSGGPYRVLYVSGRPNWEFKYLRRALEDDDEIQLVGLLRIAKKQPKFTFRSSGSSSNPLFRGFDSDEEVAEAYDEPVILRLGTKDGEELRTGFPKVPEELFGYHAVILDDIEADFFTQDQKELLHTFVSQRGGGLLMLGGQETFQGGDYARTSIGELLPVYADRVFRAPGNGDYRLSLTREGWLEPWTRLRPTEAEESQRLEKLPPFDTVNRLESIKPGARVLAEVTSGNDVSHPALVTQQFGRGRTAALLIGDFWKWHLRRDHPESDDFEKAWRQTVRWLVADVPKRVAVKSITSDAASGAFIVRTTVRGEDYRLLDNAEVAVEVVDPQQQPVAMTAVPVADVSGEYEFRLTPREIGAYRMHISANGPDGSPIGEAASGVVYDPTAEELRQLNVDRELLTSIAERTGGEVIELANLSAFVETLAEREAPIKQTSIVPIWHNWIVLLIAIGLLAGEWGLRRWKGMP